MGHAIEVICSSCRWDARAKSWIFQGELYRQRFADPEDAKLTALSLRDGGVSVIIRPTFNEPHLGRYGNREWRSFDGDLFREVHHFSPVETDCCNVVRLDEEIILPNIPG